ncbi:MAG TPA: hypothetical protein VEB86_00240 [Chryseosolibacter sp.]|nr:hypothetical protein [Chryseosolibacter sp.]
MKAFSKTILIVVIFSVAMAALEGAVVVYLRALYYPDGFTVAFKVIDENILLVELMRELATIVMLVTIGMLAAKSFQHRLAYFLIAFAVWDIFYYLWLKAFIGWPESLLEWDILFLIPWTWLGPVLAPVICSLTMTVFAWAILRSSGTRTFSRVAWLLWIAGTLAILFTFLKDYGAIIIGNGFLSDYENLMRNPEFVRIASSYVPESYDWRTFIIGELLILGGIIKMYGPVTFWRSGK